MPLNRSWKKELETRNIDVFVGRENYLSEFSSNFVTDQPRYLLFSVTGEGGVGKSTLLRQFESLAKSPRQDISAIVICCDEEYISPSSVMNHVAEVLKTQKISNESFSERNKTYQKLLQDIEGDAKAPRSVLNMVLRGTTDFVIKTAKKAPGISVIAEHVDEKEAGDVVIDTADYLINRFSNKDELQLIKSPEKILTPLFIDLINEAVTKHRLILTFDTFERTKDYLSNWLLDLLSSEFGDFDTRITFVISGRDPLDQQWTKLSASTCHIQLEPFTLDETKAYLARQNVTDEHLINQIYDDTSGLPVLVELLASRHPQPDIPLPDISKDAVTRFLQWISDPEQRRVAVFSAIPHTFNKNILSTLLDKDSSSEFDWLISQSFVRSKRNTGYYYHEKVRELILRHLYLTSPKQLALAHERLSEYFASRVNDPAMNTTTNQGDVWIRLKCEYFYHYSLANLEQAGQYLTHEFLYALRRSYKFALIIKKLIKELCRESEVIASSPTIQIIVDKNQHKSTSEYLQTIETLKLMYGEKTVPIEVKNSIAALLGKQYVNLGDFDIAEQYLNEAIGSTNENSYALTTRAAVKYFIRDDREGAFADLTNALSLDPYDLNALHIKTMMLVSENQVEDALECSNTLISHAPNEAVSYLLRSGVYEAQNKLENSLEDCNQSLLLDKSNALSYSQRAKVLYKQKSYTAALSDVNRALILDPKEPFALATRGQIYLEQNKVELAQRDFDNAERLFSQNRPGLEFFALGRLGVMTAKGQSEYVIQVTDQLFKLQNIDNSVLYFRLIALMHLEKYDDAKQCVTRMIEQDSSNLEAYIIRSRVNRLLGDYEESIKDLAHILSIDAKHTKALTEKALTLRFSGDYPGALETLDSAIEECKREDNGSFIAHRGELYRRLTRYEDALKDFTRALRIDKNDLFSLSRRIATLKTMKRSADVVSDTRRAILIRCHTYADHYNLAIVYVIGEQFAEALRNLKIAFEQEPLAKQFAIHDDLFDPIRNIEGFKYLIANKY